ncbi:MAG: MBL fold metallo-hydrolase [bacterium]
MKGIVILLSVCFGIILHAQNQNDISITYFGHSCFLISTSRGTNILTDPVDKFGYRIPGNIIIDLVTVSHNHADHNAVNAVPGKPKILYGIDKNGKAPFQKFLQMNEAFKDVQISNVSSNHFPPAHSPELNSIFVFEFDSIRIAHMGDIGLELTEEQIKKMGTIDILMIPVGGEYTVSLGDADKIIKQMKPQIAVIPMHYKTESTGFLKYTVDDFIRDKADFVEFCGNTYKPFSNKKSTGVKYVVLKIDRR